MIRSMTIAGFVLVGLTAYAVGQHTQISSIVQAQTNVRNVYTELDKKLAPILKKHSGDKAEDEARATALEWMGHLRQVLVALNETTDREIDKLAAGKK